MFAPVSMLEAAPPPCRSANPDRDLHQQAPGFTTALCDCEADIAPTPPANMIGLW